MKALVVDDDRVLADVVGFTLRREGFEVIQAHDGYTAVRRWSELQPDIVILDVNLPNGNGFEICRQIRERADTPIIMLTVRDDEDDIVHGLGMGADDYVTKPFSPRQLIARVQAVIRRTGKIPTRAIRHIGVLTLLPEYRQLQCENREPVPLTRLENRLLDYLVLNAGRVLSSEMLIDYVWGMDGGDNDMLRQLIHRLRSKIAQACDNTGDVLAAAYIETIPGLGYIIHAPAQTDS
ncbi:MAG: response regulator transcription factor [Anaerolineae bacterium]|nr:response regulator transcription factor [Anaerolineae bacterium]